MSRLIAGSRTPNRSHLAVWIGFAVAGCLTAAGCGADDSTTELNPDGPPMVRQVFTAEKVDVSGVTRVRTGLAFGDHPQIEPDEDDRQVDAAVADGDIQEIRIVFDELLRGNSLEELACADGSFSRIPVGTDPDDIADCSGPAAQIASTCTEVCICTDGNAACAQAVGLGMPIGILDENEDGASDDFRMIDYGGGELAASIVCDGQPMPLDQQQSFYNPSGNQLIPAGPIGIDGLGPAIILIPSQGLRTGSTCTITFREEVVDKEGNRVCAPAGGDIEADCDEGDTSEISFTMEPLGLSGSSPPDGATNVQTTSNVQLQFNASIDADTAGAITVTANGAAVGATPTVDVDDPSIVRITIAGGLAAGTEYVITIGTGLTDVFGAALPQQLTVTFTTA